MGKINYWKISAIVLLLLLFVAVKYKYKTAKEEVYDIHGFKIPRIHLDSFSDTIDSDAFVVCNMKEDDCIYIYKPE